MNIVKFFTKSKSRNICSLIDKMHKKITKFFAILPIAIFIYLCYNNNVLKGRTEREEQKNEKV